MELLDRRRRAAPDVGLRESKTRASAILRDVRDRRARYVITVRGWPVGVLMPVAEAPETVAEADAWRELIEIGKEIERGRRSPRTSTEILSEMRR